MFIPKEKRRFHVICNSWRASISQFIHFDLLMCRRGDEIILIEFYYFVVIITALSASFHSTLHPKLSAIALAGTRVLPSTI